jgi:hypothetical protein
MTLLCDKKVTIAKCKELENRWFDSHREYTCTDLADFSEIKCKMHPDFRNVKMRKRKSTS